VAVGYPIIAAFILILKDRFLTGMNNEIEAALIVFWQVIF
jgi:hypothetical protein